RDQDLNTERTEDLRDLSVEALEARRSQRTPHWLRPAVALSRAWSAAERTGHRLSTTYHLQGGTIGRNKDYRKEQRHSADRGGVHDLRHGGQGVRSGGPHRDQPLSLRAFGEQALLRQQSQNGRISVRGRGAPASPAGAQAAGCVAKSGPVGPEISSSSGTAAPPWLRPLCATEAPSVASNT